MRKLDLTGLPYGDLIVRESAGVNKHGKTVWLCDCKCGGTVIAIGSELMSGHTTSCGCRRVEVGKAKATHGHRRDGKQSMEYTAWVNMKARCETDPDYAGRGITVCERWLNCFENFLADMGSKPGTGHEFSIDRIDNDGNYEPTNCKWSTAHEQKVNQRPRRWHRKPKQEPSNWTAPAEDDVVSY